MKNQNLMSKLKALKGIHSAMDERDAERMRPKKAVPVESVEMQPQTALEPDHTPGMHSLEMPGENSLAQGNSQGLQDDDKARLLDLYSKLK